MLSKYFPPLITVRYDTLSGSKLVGTPAVVTHGHSSKHNTHNDIHTQQETHTNTHPNLYTSTYIHSTLSSRSIPTPDTLINEMKSNKFLNGYLEAVMAALYHHTDTHLGLTVA